MESLDVDDMLVQTCCTTGTGAVKSTVEHYMAGLGNFAGTSLRRE